MKMLYFIPICILVLFLGCTGKKENKNRDVYKNLLTVGLASFAADSAFSQYAQSNIDLKNFLGKWSEYKRIDNSFQSGLYNVTAEYGFIDSNRISVKNSGITKSGSVFDIAGIGIIPTLKKPGIVKVSFFPLFFSDYYILKIDTDCRYALIGSPVPEILWLLSRNGSYPPSIESDYIQFANSIGYKTALLQSFIQ